MQKEIPNIVFNSKDTKSYDIEIITIKSLIERQKDLKHNPEKPHQLEFNLIAFYTHGKSKHFADFVWYDVTPNTVIHLSKGQINAFKFTQDLNGFIILFKEDYLNKQLLKLPQNKVGRFFNSNLFSPKIEVPQTSNIKKYIALFFEEFKNEKENDESLNVNDFLFVIIMSKFAELTQHQTFKIKNTEKLNTFFEFKNLVASSFTKSRSANFYASKLNITYKHLNEICKDILGNTAKNFIDEFIILEAKRKLINSRIKSNELAYLMGFEEATNFVKYFKKHTGFPPNIFKNKYQ